MSKRFNILVFAIKMNGTYKRMNLFIWISELCAFRAVLLLLQQQQLWGAQFEHTDIANGMMESYDFHFVNDQSIGFGAWGGFWFGLGWRGNGPNETSKCQEWRKVKRLLIEPNAFGRPVDALRMWLLNLSVQNLVANKRFNIPIQMDGSRIDGWDYRKWILFTHSLNVSVGKCSFLLR